MNDGQHGRRSRASRTPRPPRASTPRVHPARPPRAYTPRVHPSRTPLASTPRVHPARLPRASTRIRAACPSDPSCCGRHSPRLSAAAAAAACLTAWRQASCFTGQRSYYACRILAQRGTDALREVLMHSERHSCAQRGTHALSTPHTRPEGGPPPLLPEHLACSSRPHAPKAGVAVVAVLQPRCNTVHAV